MKKLKVGVVGCGNISGIYFKQGYRFNNYEIVAAADMLPGKAQAKVDEVMRLADEWKVKIPAPPRVLSPEQLLADPEVELVLNLTVPKAHASIALQALENGKHTYGEKPFAIHREDGRKIVELAKKKNLRAGSAPDTFLGGGHQTARKLIDDGWIGEPVAATAFMVCAGHESWHPSPQFYYEVGGGPMFDMGPYYLTALVNMLGPVKKVAGMTRITFPERTITSQPLAGTVMKVETPTHLTGTLQFASGALGTVIMSFDVGNAELPLLQVIGTQGTIIVPDPNGFGGNVRYRRRGQSGWTEIAPLFGYQDNSRGLGVADLAAAIEKGRPARASGELALHVLDTMEAFLDAGATDQTIKLTTTCQRPAPLPMGLRDGQVD